VAIVVVVVAVVVAAILTAAVAVGRGKRHGAAIIILSMTIVALALLAFLPMILEARRSTLNEAAMRRAGAIEPADDVYRLMQVAYPAVFVAMIVESWMADRPFSSRAMAGAALFLAAKALKYWAIATLGDRWSFRVLVPPGSQRILHGPYRVMRHPNYVGVAGEIVGFAVLARAPIAGLVAVLLFGALLVARIRVEERALGLRSR
jgi:methyltransferase